VKPSFLKTDVNSDSLIQKLNFQLSNIGSSNFTLRKIEGTTAAAPDTQFLEKHGLLVAPRFWMPSIGDVYIAYIDNNYVDVRSRLAAQKFVIYLIQE